MVREENICQLLLLQQQEWMIKGTLHLADGWRYRKTELAISVFALEPCSDRLPPFCNTG